MRNPKRDVVFKKIFENPKTKHVLIGLLNECFELETLIVDIKFLKKNLEVYNKVDKHSIVDILVTDQAGLRYIIEMQVSREASFIERCLYYMASVFQDLIEEGQGYNELTPVKVLAICDFNLTRSKDYKTNHKIMDVKHMTITTHAFEICFLELKKFRFSFSELNSITEKVAYFLTAYNDLDFAENCKSDSILRLLMELADTMYLDKEERLVYKFDKMTDHPIEVFECFDKERRRLIQEFADNKIDQPTFFSRIKRLNELQDLQ